MNRGDAIILARKMAKKTKQTCFVVYEDHQYFAATQFDLDTFFNGIEPEVVVFSDGSFES